MPLQRQWKITCNCCGETHTGSAKETTELQWQYAYIGKKPYYACSKECETKIAEIAKNLNFESLTWHTLVVSR